MFWRRHVPKQVKITPIIYLNSVWVEQIPKFVLIKTNKDWRHFFNWKNFKSSVEFMTVICKFKSVFPRSQTAKKMAMNSAKKVNRLIKIKLATWLHSISQELEYDSSLLLRSNCCMIRINRFIANTATWYKATPKTAASWAAHSYKISCVEDASHEQC